jgi:hypothetical protein
LITFAARIKGMIGELKLSFKTHTLAYIYAAVILLLAFGVYSETGGTHISKIAIYAATLYGCYILFHFLKLRKWLTKLFDNWKDKLAQKNTASLAYILFAYVILSIIGHLIYVGGIPAIQAVMLEDNVEVAQLRRSITADAPKLLNYFASFNLRAFIPFLILFFFVKNKKFFYWAILLVGAFYAYSLMQKSYIICIIIPVLCYAIMQKKYWHTLIHVFIIGLVIFGQMKIANPQVVDDPTEIQLVEDSNDSIATSEVRKRGKVEKLLYGLVNRIAYVPGRTVSHWFDIVPAEKPFLYGDGYRIVAKLKGSTYHNYFAELYPLMYPKYAARGLKGSVNTASFVVDYANFGRWGLIMSGVILSLFLIFIESLFQGDFSIKFSLNIYSILIISSTMLTTTLLTGGWFFILLMYLFLYNKKAETA